MNQYLYSNRNYVLRKVLNKPENADIIKDLIESILSINIKKISVNPYVEKNKRFLPEEEKFGVVDVRIGTDTHQEYNVGIQFVDGKHLKTKIALYYLYIHSNQICYDDDRKISKTITINFLDFPYKDGNCEYHKVAMLNKVKTVEFEEQEAEAHIIELPEFKILNPNDITREEQWIAYINGADEKIMKKIMDANKYIVKLDKMVQEYWENETI